MTIEQAIEKAIEGGWVCKNEWGSSIVDTPRERILIDPLFWKSLGKAMGWGDEMVCIDETGHPKEWGYYFHCPVCGEIVHGERQECPSECETDYPPIESWKYHWHRFIDHLAEGKDAESFFSNL